MDVEKGCIKNYHSFGDYFGNGDTEELKALLHGCMLEEQAIRERLEGFNLESCYSCLSMEEFIQLLVG